VGRRTTIAEAALAILARHGPLELEELTRLAVEQGVTRAKRPEVSVRQALEREPRVALLLDGRWVSVPATLEGVVLAHRLDEEEVATDSLPVHPDFAPLDPLGIHGLPLASGGNLQSCSEGHLHGPPGWLGDRKAGELVALRLREGTVEVAPAAVVDEVGDLGVRRLAAVVERELTRTGAGGVDRPAPALPLTQVVLQAMVEAPGLRRHAAAPLGALLAGAGLETHGWLVGRAGTDWREWDEILGSDDDDDGDEDEEDLSARVAELLGVDEWAVEGAAEVARMVELCGRSPDALRAVSGHTELMQSLAEVLDVPGVAALVQVLCLGEPAAEAVLGAVADAAEGRLQAPPTWLLARVAEQRGDPLAAEALDVRAAEIDPDFAPALLDAARAAEDRGDARTARERLLRAGIDPDAPQLRRVEHYARLRPAAAAGRNAPCPCGSGRKYKLCCLRRAALPLRDRAVWLLERATSWALLPAQRLAVADLVTEDDDELIGVLAEDVALFDRGLLERYLELRGPLLQADEVRLARRWLDTRPDMWDVEQVGAGNRVRLRNLVSGEVAEVTRRSPEAPLGRLDVLYARVGPDGPADEAGQMLLGGTVKIHRLLRPQLQQLLERRPTGEQVLDWFRDALHPRPPSLVNFEGEPILLSTARYRVPDPAAAVQRLRYRLEESEGEFLDTVEVDGRPIHRGRVRLDGDVLEIETNSASGCAGSSGWWARRSRASGCSAASSTPRRRRWPTGRPPTLHRRPTYRPGRSSAPSRHSWLSRRNAGSTSQFLRWAA
jgi:SEC-C motif